MVYPLFMVCSSSVLSAKLVDCAKGTATLKSLPLLCLCFGWGDVHIIAVSKLQRKWFNPVVSSGMDQTTLKALGTFACRHTQRHVQKPAHVRKPAQKWVSLSSYSPTWWVLPCYLQTPLILTLKSFFLQTLHVCYRHPLLLKKGPTVRANLPSYVIAGF